MFVNRIGLLCLRYPRVHALFLISVVFWALTQAAPALARTTTKSGDQYVQECADAGVPIPPPLNFETVTDPDYNPDPALPHWVYQGVLDTKFTNGMTSEPLPAHIFYYLPPDNSGLCMALPRLAEQDDNDTVPPNLELFGVTARATGRARPVSGTPPTFPSPRRFV